MNFDERLSSIEERLERLERLALLDYNQIRDLARYTRDGLSEAVEYAFDVSPEENDLEPPSLRRPPNMKPLDDRELVAAGGSIEELSLLKMMMVRGFVFQARRDVLTIALDLVRALKVRAEEKDEAEAA